MESNNTTCDSSLDHKSTFALPHLISYYVIFPLHFIIGTPSRVLWLITFYRQYKKDREGYMYQIFSSFVDTMELITALMYVLSVHCLSGFGAVLGSQWYQTQYWLMWYAANFAVPVINSSVTASLLLTLSMTIDRVFALYKPFRYKNIDHKTHQAVAYISCMTLGIVTGIYDDDLFRIQEEDDKIYKLVVDLDNVVMPTPKALTQLRNALRLISLISLISRNICLIKLLHHKYTKVSHMTSNKKEEERIRKSKETTLIQLTVCQSVLCTVSVLANVIGYGHIYVSEKFARCDIIFVAPIVDGIIELADILYTYLQFVISKQLRNVVFSIVPCLKQFSNNVV